MGKILVIKELERLALEPRESPLILFGEKDFLRGDRGVYDFIFYYKESVELRGYPSPTSLVYPVLPYEGSDEDRIALVVEFKKLHPEQRHVAVSNSEFLEFFELTEFGGVHLGNYNSIDREAFMDLRTDNNAAIEDINEKTRQIDELYNEAIS